MPHDKEHKRKSKKKRQPSFTLPKNPYNYQYGSTRSTAKKKGPLIGTWTRLRSPGKPGQGQKGHDDKVQNRNGFLKLNEKVSHNLNVQEIGSWMQKQKELYARHKRPPAVPRRSPETKITSTDLQPREVGHIDDALPPADYEDDEQAPESGYITPEQQSSELEYPLPSQHRVAQGTQNSPSGSVSSNQSTPHHICQSHTTTVQAEVHVSYTEDNRNSLASLGSIPSMPPPPPPNDAMALQMNPLLGSSVKHISMMSASSGSSSGTLHDPCQPDDIYQHYIAPSEDSNGPLHQAAYGGVVASVISNKESNTYETTLPSPGTQTMPNVDNFMNRPLPAPPGGGRQYNTMNHLGQNNMPNSGAATMMANQMGMTLDEFPPPPPQFAGGEAVTSLQHHQTSRPESGPGAHHPRAADPSSNKNSLPFPVKLRPVGSPLLNDSNTDSSTYQYKDTIDVFSVVVPPPSQQSKGAPPPIKPKIRPGDQFPGSVFPSLCANPAAPSSQFPAPPSPISPNEYSEIINELVLPPPPPPPTVGGISADLANRIQEWTISNQDRPSRPGRNQSVDAHTALLSQIQTGIKLRKSPFSNKLFDTSQRDDTPIQHAHVVTYPNPDYTYADSIETCSTISGESSSSGCHSNSSYSNSTTGSPPPPQTLPKPRKQHPDVTQLPGYQPVPSNCPAWKVNMIEKKNQQLEDDARRKLIAQREEENRWKDIPEWKRNLIMEKEKRKVAPLEAERRKREEEMAKLQSMPDWKRDLILKKRGDQ